MHLESLLSNHFVLLIARQGIFTIMHYYLPKAGALSLHSSANEGAFVFCAEDFIVSRRMDRICISVCVCVREQCDSRYRTQRRCDGLLRP
jgi:hypothetical protein